MTWSLAVICLLESPRGQRLAGRWSEVRVGGIGCCSNAQQKLLQEFPSKYNACKNSLQSLARNCLLYDTGIIKYISVFEWRGSQSLSAPLGCWSISLVILKSHRFCWQAGRWRWQPSLCQPVCLWRAHALSFNFPQLPTSESIWEQHCLMLLYFPHPYLCQKEPGHASAEQDGAGICNSWFYLLWHLL